MSETIIVPTPAPLGAARELTAGYRKMSSVLLALIFKDYKGRSSKGILAILASLLQPLTRTLFFSFLWYETGRTSFHGIPSLIYIASGVFCYMIVQVAMRRLPGAIGANQAFLGFPQVKPVDALLSRFIIEMITLIASFGMFMFVLWWFFDIAEYVREPLPLIGMFAICVIIAIGVGLLLGVYSHLFNGIRAVAPFLSMPIFFTSGALHPVAGLAPDVRAVLAWNPLFHIIDYARHYWFGTRLSPDNDIFYAMMFSVIVLGFGFLAYYRNRVVLVQR